MQENSQNTEVKKFDVIFEKLAEAKAEQGFELSENINFSMETAKTIMLFREFQESTVLQSYSVFTKG